MMVHKKAMVILCAITLFASCKTVDVENKMISKIKEDNQNLKSKNEQLEKAVESFVQVEKTEYTVNVDPVIVPYKETIVISDSQFEKSKVNGNDTVRKAMTEALVTPENQIGGTQLFDYNDNKQFPIITRKLAQTIIQLEPGEEPIGAPFMSDTIRWELEGEVWTKDGIDTQLVIVKPLEVGLYTNMLIVTNRRLYNFILQSTKDIYMPMVRFQYPLSKEFLTSQIKKAQREAEYKYEAIDSQYISANYKISSSIFFPPLWVPTLVYDDGQKTYIMFPDVILQREFPVVFEEKKNMLNYRVKENIMVIDKLVNKVTIKIGKKTVTVTKKRGTAKVIDSEDLTKKSSGVK